MSEDWLADLPHYDDFRNATGAVDWKEWRAAVVAAVDEIVRREGEDESGPVGG